MIFRIQLLIPLFCTTLGLTDISARFSGLRVCSCQSLLFFYLQASPQSQIFLFRFLFGMFSTQHRREKSSSFSLLLRCPNMSSESGDYLAEAATGTAGHTKHVQNHFSKYLEQ